MPEIGRSDPEYWLKMLMGVGIIAHQLGEKLREEEELCDPDGSVHETKMRAYGLECDCNERNTRLIMSAPLSSKQRMIMKQRYLKKKPWNGIVRYMSIEKRYAYRIHKHALQGILRRNSGTDFEREYLTEKARFDEINPYTREYENE